MITEIGLFQIALYLFVLLVLVKPLGWYMAQIYQGKLFAEGNVEKWLYRLCQIQPQQNMNWKQYLSAMLLFNISGLIVVYIILRLQSYFPFNPQHLSAPSPDLAFNTAVSFATNTDWQSYSGETTMSYFTQMIALTTQNFLSGATGMALFVALIRGLAKHERKTLGNFWVDMVRGVLYILLPLSLIFALVLVSQGVIQNLKPNQTVRLTEPISYQTNKGIREVKEQIIPMGPVASQVAIKQLGTNGGGFFNTNAAHPFENPTPLTNFLEMLAILLIPAAFCYTFGTMVKNTRQGWAMLAAMVCIFIPFLLGAVISEQENNPAVNQLGINVVGTNPGYPGGNMEGKETRFGIVSSVLWTIATTAASNGSINSMLDSYTPIGGLMPLWLMQLGEVVFGGVGSGLAGMVILMLITVFVSGLMVGRTPEYLGKKIQPFEMKMASIAVLIMPLIVLLATAISVVTKVGVNSVTNSGAHGFTEILYAFSSMANNNGSAFSGLNSNTPFYNLLGGIVMLIGRYWIAIPILAIAGSLVQKKIIPKTSGTLATDTPLFVVLLVSVTMLLGALSFLPALALGPIAEQLTLESKNGF